MEPIGKWTIWDPIPDRDRTPINPTMMTIHTAVSRSQDIYGPQRGPGGTYAHFYNPENGPLRQHQEINRIAYADLHANTFSVSVEHWDGYPGKWSSGEPPKFTERQLENDAKLFAYLVLKFGLPNRVATPDNLSGLGWHRLGCNGDFGAFNPNNPTTWCYKQSGVLMSRSYGKTCPGNRRILQIKEIYNRAQKYILGRPVVKQVAKKRLEEEEEDMPKNTGIYWDEDPKTVKYAILNYGSGAWHEFSNGTGRGPLGGDYNNPVAKAFDTNTWAKVTKGHAANVKKACEEIRSHK